MRWMQGLFKFFTQSLEALVAGIMQFSRFNGVFDRTFGFDGVGAVMVFALA